jgi:hypothetical protein
MKMSDAFKSMCVHVHVYGTDWHALMLEEPEDIAVFRKDYMNTD